MATLTSWPKAPFSIWSQIAGRHTALTYDPGATPALYLTWFNATANQLWVAIELNTMGETPSAFIYNLATGYVLQYTNLNGVASNLTMGLPSPSDPGQNWDLFTVDNSPSWFSIRPLTDTGSCIAYNNQSDFGVELLGYYDDPKTAFTIREETGAVIPVDQGTFSNQVSAAALSTTGETVVIDNEGMTTDYTGSVSLTYADERSYAFIKTDTQTVTKRITASLGISGVLAKVLTIKADLSFSEEFTDTSTIQTSDTHTTTITRQYTCNTNVPGGKSYQYSIQTNSVPFSADYVVNAQLYPSYPNAAPVSIQLPSNYVGRNTTSVTIVITDVSSSNTTGHVEVSRKVIPLR